MSIRADVRTFLHDNQILLDAEAQAISDDFPLLDSGALDSIGVYQLVRFLESQLAIVVTVDDMARTSFSSLLDIERFVQGKKQVHAKP